MKHKSKLSEMLIAFCICTTGITLLEGIMGMLFFPEETLSYKAFFAPPIFGVISVFLGFVTWSPNELSVKQVIFRRVLHLLLIEGMVYGLNYISGNIFSIGVSVALVFGVAAVYVMVQVILWINDRRSANNFNQKLKEYQTNQQNYLEQ